MVITIDGVSGLGKSTICQMIASQLSMRHINTGKLYRYITWKVLQRNENEIDDRIFEAVNEMDIFEANSLDDSILRSKDVTAHVNRIANKDYVRKEINSALLRQTIGEDVVLDGRDIGTHVFPDSKFKFYLTATAEERANRRYN